MNACGYSLDELFARLPELEWKLSRSNSVLNPALLPRGLFRSRLEFTPSSCIEEIRADIKAIKRQKNEEACQYLAERVGQKINVLVRLCQHAPKIKASEKHVNLAVKSIGTRQKWLQTMQDEIDTLSLQQQALTATLQRLQQDHNPQAELNLQAELGRVEQRLTLAQETFARSTVF